MACRVPSEAVIDCGCDGVGAVTGPRYFTLGKYFLSQGEAGEGSDDGQNERRNSDGPTCLHMNMDMDMDMDMGMDMHTPTLPQRPSQVKSTGWMYVIVSNHLTMHQSYLLMWPD